MYSASEMPKDGRTFVRTKRPAVDQALWVSNYNTYYGEDFTNFKEIRHHYETVNEITSIFGVTSKLWRYDFINICADCRVLLEDPISELYNDLNETSFKTRFQCQQDYFKKLGYVDIEDAEVIDFYTTINEYLKALPAKDLHNNLI